MERDVATQLIEFAVDTKYEDIPEETLEFTKCLTLKTVAGMLAGSTTPSAQKMAGIIRDRKLPEECGVIGSDFKTSLWEAVLLGVYFAHAKELEDDRYVYGVSWDITVIPLLFPLAEKLGLSGKALLEALVVGLEIHTRTCLFSAHHLGLFVVPGAVGPAVGAAKALGLGVKETAAAFGLAMSGVPISMVNLGTDAHFFESALQSLQGIMAAEMAKVGLSGNPDINTYLTNHLGKERVVPEEMVEDLGKRWVLQEIQIKKYPCCIAHHRQIDSVIELRKKHNLSFEDVETIEVHSRRKGDIRQNRPEPKDANDLQFSIQHTLGAAMLDGDVGLEHMTEDTVVEPRLKEARSKVKFIPAPDDSPGGTLGESFDEPACVVIKTKDGKTFSRERQYVIGSFQEPLSLDQFRELYHKFTCGILSEENISKSAGTILNLESIDSVKEIMDIFSKGDK
ncbi:MAG TPA: MmgE/PrpD family protein [Desulfatiglandales bacterium]|nr:MmgE/PrpD family protein [Desulfatiglandales bacterium]HUX80442.1 MmgE/PrpD family protein [Alphaproteobacteria bacterium]